MKPCNNCKNKESCVAFNFMRENCHCSPWKLNSYLYEKFSHISIIAATSGDFDNIELECGDYDPIRDEVDYSSLSNSSPKPHQPKASLIDKCGSCKGKCGV